MNEQQTKELYSKVFKELKSDMNDLVAKYQADYNLPILVALELQVDLPIHDEPGSPVRTRSNIMWSRDTYYLEKPK